MVQAGLGRRGHVALPNPDGVRSPGSRSRSKTHRQRGVKLVEDIEASVGDVVLRLAVAKALADTKEVWTALNA